MPKQAEFIGVQRAFGHVREIPKNVEETRIIPIIISSTAKDRHGTILNMDGWNLDNYNNNPIVGYQHDIYGSWYSDNNPDKVVGCDTGIVFEGEGDERIMIGNPHFETKEINELAEKIFRKMVFKSLRAASVGFAPVGKGKWVEDGEGNETFYFAGQELMEYSIVNIPSNPDAVARGMRHEVEGVLNYALQQLGDKFSRVQLNNMCVADVLLLLEGRDININTTDIEKVKRQLAEQTKKTDEAVRLRDFYKMKAGL